MIAALVLACVSACAPLPRPPAESVAGCSATDGDTMRCGDERIRLLGIDAPELAGHCRAGRTCVEGDGDASRKALAAAMAGRVVTVRRTGADRYGRTLGVVEADGVSLSCRQIEGGFAVYVRRWDDQRLVARTCPEAAR